MHLLISQLLFVKTVLGVPFGGWGPGEGYGNAGFDPPAKNPNSIFGYDYFGVTSNRYNYSAIVMENHVPRTMKDPMFTSMVPQVSRNNKRKNKSLPTPILRLNSKKRPKSSGRDGRRFKSLKPSTKYNQPFIPKKQRNSGKIQDGRQREKNTNEVKRGRQLGKKRKSLSASDLWKLNRAATNYLTAEKEGQNRNSRSFDRKKQSPNFQRQTGKNLREENFRIKSNKKWPRRQF